jgi:hypothetical protein
VHYHEGHKTIRIELIAHLADDIIPDRILHAQRLLFDASQAL